MQRWATSRDRERDRKRGRRGWNKEKERERAWAAIRKGERGRKGTSSLGAS